MTKENDYYSEFGYYIHKVVDLIDKNGNKLFQQHLGISLMQFSLLIAFDTETKKLPSQQILSEQLGIAKSAVSRHVSIAQNNGWLSVEQSATSRRQNTLTLTRAGKKLLEDAKQLIQQSEHIGFDDMSPDDVAATMRVLKSLHNKLAVRLDR